MNLESPLVTVRIPSYNHARFVEKTILAVLNQTFQDFELIVIDDCSTDGSDEIISRLQEQHNFTYIRHTENKGITYSMNEFNTLARGKYMAGCGSDDFWEPNKLELQVAFMEANPDFAVCYGKAMQITEDDEKVGEISSDSYRTGWLFDEIITKKLSLVAPTTMMRLEALREVRGYDSGFMEDFPMWLKLADKYQFGFIDEVLTNYRVHPGNLTRQFEKRMAHQKQIIDAYKHKPIYKEANALWHLRCFALYSRNGMKEAKAHLQPSLRFLFTKPFILAFLMYLKNVALK